MKLPVPITADSVETVRLAGEWMVRLWVGRQYAEVYLPFSITERINWVFCHRGCPRNLYITSSSYDAGQHPLLPLWFVMFLADIHSHREERNKLKKLLL
jgi:hypothetical protein